MPIRRPLLLIVLAALAAALIPAAAQAKAAPKPKQQLYVSLGDSYASGYQPDVGGNTRNGFVYQVPGLARKRGYNLKIVNFGCAGATTSSLLNQVGCAPKALGPGGIPYPNSTQVAAATKFIKAHRAQVALITVSISGNDVTKCATAAEPIPCVGAATDGINTNVTTIAQALRTAAGPKPKIVGTTYPDVVLGAWVRPGGDSGQSLAKLSTVAFSALINPALKKAYAAAGGSFVDVTTATGAYGDITAMTTLAPYGSIPVPVATVCRISFYCDRGDIHLRTPGYGIIAGLVAKELPRR